MSAASDYLELKLLDHSLGTAAYTAPTNVYVGLHTSSPADDASGTGEVSGNGYARKEATFAAASAGEASTSATITFDAASGGNWGTFSHIGIYVNSTGGNLLFHGAVTTSKTIEDGDTFQISSGNLTISLD